MLIKVSESRYITLFLVSGSIRKLFSTDCAIFIFSQYFSQLIVSIFIFSPYFFQHILPGGKVRGYSTLAISWFINFDNRRTECLTKNDFLKCLTLIKSLKKVYNVDARGTFYSFMDIFLLTDSNSLSTTKLSLNVGKIT